MAREFAVKHTVPPISVWDLPRRAELPEPAAAAVGIRSAPVENAEDWDGGRDADEF